MWSATNVCYFVVLFLISTYCNKNVFKFFSKAESGVLYSEFNMPIQRTDCARALHWIPGISQNIISFNLVYSHTHYINKKLIRLTLTFCTIWIYFTKFCFSFKNAMLKLIRTIMRKFTRNKIIKSFQPGNNWIAILLAFCCT